MKTLGPVPGLLCLQWFYPHVRVFAFGCFLDNPTLYDERLNKRLGLQLLQVTHVLKWPP